MGLFGNKKKGNENLHTLTEKEIQSKLYGHIRNNRSFVQEDPVNFPKPPDSISFQKNTSTATKPFAPAVSRHNVSSELFKTRDEDSDFFSEKKSEEQPLFQTKAVETELRPRPSVISSAAAASQKNRSHKPASSDFLGKLSAVGSAVQKSSAALGSQILGILGIVLVSILRLAASVDFRKPNVRRVVYGLTAALALGLVLVGIHFLNLSRETAMKNPPKQTISQKKKAADAKVTTSLNSVLTPVTLTPAEANKSKTTADTKKKIAAKDPAKTEKQSPDNLSTTEVKNAPAVETKTPAAAPKPAAVSEGSYVIQVATFAAREDAEKLVKRFNDAGLNSFQKSISRSAGRVYYCVFIGRFKTHQEADRKLADFKKSEVSKPFQDSFVRSV